MGRSAGIAQGTPILRIAGDIDRLASHLEIGIAGVCRRRAGDKGIIDNIMSEVVCGVSGGIASLEIVDDIVDILRIYLCQWAAIMGA